MTEHPRRRAEDVRDPRVGEALVHLEYLRERLDDLNDKVGIQNGRIYKTEIEMGEVRTRAATLAQTAIDRANTLDRNIKILGIVVAIVGAGVKFL
jgi:hypothetical protein